MAARELRTDWTTSTHRCALWRIDGNLELRLYAGGHVVALATCRDLPQAAMLAEEWRDRLPSPVPRPPST